MPLSHILLAFNMRGTHNTTYRVRVAWRRPGQVNNKEQGIMDYANGETNAPRRRCARCGVRFMDGPPPGPPPGAAPGTPPGTPPGADLGGREAGDIEWLRCPDCGLRFWADPAGGADGRCAVGLYREDAP